MRKSLKLPKDLRRFAIIQALKRIIPCFILIIIFATLLIIFGGRIFRNTNNASRNSGYYLIMMIPFVITGVPLKLLDITYWGVVTEVSMITTIDNESSVWPTIEGAYRKNTLYLTVNLSDGRNIRNKALEARADSIQPIEHYRKNDCVFHLYGSRYTVILPKAKDLSITCAVCGTANTSDSHVCRSCGHTLIKYIEGGIDYEE